MANLEREFSFEIAWVPDCLHASMCLIINLLRVQRKIGAFRQETKARKFHESMELRLVLAALLDLQDLLTLALKQ